MITRIVLKNFMPHKLSNVSLVGSTVAVTGRNGEGKSAFLEAVPYVYYGVGREDIAGMSRINGDGSHEVALYETADIGDVVIKRGCKSSGIGYSTVHVNDALVAKGKETKTWVENYLGMDADTYMLTAFFGLKDVRHDVLINVLPSARLDALNKLNNSGPYPTFAQKAKAALSIAELDYETAKSRKEGAEAVLLDTDFLMKQVEELTETEVKLSASIAKEKEKRRSLRVEEERYQAFVKEKERLSVQRKTSRETIDAIESDIASLLEELVTDSDEINLLIHDKQLKLDEFVNEAVDVDGLKTKGLKLNDKQSRLHAVMDLKTKALGTDYDACPLCNTPLDDHTVDRWKEEVAEMRKKLESIMKEREHNDARIDSTTKLAKDIERVADDIKRVMLEVDDDRKKVSMLKRDLKKSNDDLVIMDGRYLDLAEKLGEEYQGLQSSLEKLSDSISVSTGSLGETRGQLKELKESIRVNTENTQVVKKATAEMKTANKAVRAYKILRKAWSRYGIPLSLIHELCQKIEERASAVYKSFDNGRIEVRDVEDRGKPGVQFYLIDKKGERTYGQLSEGEKVMFFVSVRVAISQITSEGGGHVEHLILDEAMSHLDPEHRDDLIRLTNKVLRKLFPQLFVVSHTVMPEIFDTTILVTADSGDSKVEVV